MISMNNDDGPGEAIHAIVRIIGSAQEFDGARILGCFPENHEFGSGGGHALGFEQYVAEVFIPAAAA